jgi:hypothetical protein
LVAATAEAGVVPEIKTPQDFGLALKAGPYTSPGGYPIYFVTEDGGALSFATAWNERANIAQAIVSGADPQWRVIGWDVNWEDAELYDDPTQNRIASAYADDDDPVVDLIPDSYHKWYRQTHGVAMPRDVKRGVKFTLDALPRDPHILPLEDYDLGDVRVVVWAVLLTRPALSIYKVELIRMDARMNRAVVADQTTIAAPNAFEAAYSAAKNRFKLSASHLSDLWNTFSSPAPRRDGGGGVPFTLDGTSNTRRRCKAP